MLLLQERYTLLTKIDFEPDRQVMAVICLSSKLLGVLFLMST
jgi:hypothetical protein